MLLLSLAILDMYGLPANIVITPLDLMEPNVGMAELACPGFAVGFQCAEKGIHDLTPFLISFGTRIDECTQDSNSY
jgi:hypothetical protein